MQISIGHNFKFLVPYLVLPLSALSALLRTILTWNKDEELWTQDFRSIVWKKPTPMKYSRSLAEFVGQLQVASSCYSYHAWHLTCAINLSEHISASDTSWQKRPTNSKPLTILWFCEWNYLKKLLFFSFIYQMLKFLFSMLHNIRVYFVMRLNHLQ